MVFEPFSLRQKTEIKACTAQQEKERWRIRKKKTAVLLAFLLSDPPGWRVRSPLSESRLTSRINGMT